MNWDRFVCRNHIWLCLFRGGETLASNGVFYVRTTMPSIRFTWGKMVWLPMWLSNLCNDKIERRILSITSLMLRLSLWFVLSQHIGFVLCARIYSHKISTTLGSEFSSFTVAFGTFFHWHRKIYPLKCNKSIRIRYSHSLWVCVCCVFSQCSSFSVNKIMNTIRSIPMLDMLASDTLPFDKSWI